MSRSESGLLDELRLNTHYAGYRHFVGLAAIMGYALAAIYAAISIMGSNAESGIASLIGAVATCIGVYLASQAALILADIADGVLRGIDGGRHE